LKFLIDTHSEKVKQFVDQYPKYFLGQLLTPLTNYKSWDDGKFAIDNGAFTRFDEKSFKRLLERNETKMNECLFVVCPDVVGSAIRTLELWSYRKKWIHGNLPIAFVAQDGQENYNIPWDQLDCLFLGGCDPWKDSDQAVAIVKTAKTLGKLVHIGRVNTAERFKKYDKLGADTCDGSGIARFSEAMLEKLIAGVEDKPNATQETLSW
jgi:hypothetical protein